ncbi:GntR family transcriptional regulator [Rhizobium rhizogenes]|uniref:GntR family transcriptional regulator n=1 Tax=Rhizobium rhizogenes TaxID=359 RepID=UPI0015717B39|nr:GntR family transcriptional regulator [Rhizobium rhizogenes]NTI38060.1 GntR family transcriptional regulator [Rhizobium rhizogenes]WEO69493.1 GntR family transcriptional regulator [Rhizobium rhizogenes]
MSDVELKSDVADTESEAPRDVTDQILQDILGGLLPPGTWLKQIDLERRYGCTRPEVRRALDRLAQKRLVEHVPNRGYHVYEQDGRRAVEVSDIRVILETAIAGQIVANASPKSILKLRTLAKRFDEMVLLGTMLELYEANLAFHRELLTLGGNNELVDLISEIRQRTSSAPVSQWRTRARVDQSGREHHLMIDAIEKGDVDELKRLTELHIRQSWGLTSSN